MSNSHRRTMAPPPPRRIPSASLRATSATPSLYNGRTSPTESLASRSLRSPAAGMKRKERDYEQPTGVEDTNINVVVRCRGRSEKEVRENSSVVVTTNGVKGNTVELAMGNSSLSNKTYHFDTVFSSAADQIMVFDTVVIPILDEVLQGFNCTIFAYGQTGTGKTYTMSGDISDVQPLSENAGIIPRVLYALFNKLDALPDSPKSGQAAENVVKVSFIELYNEKFRDLLSRDDNAKLQITDVESKRGHATTVVQGMEETHINTVDRGLELLREGSHKRQVAATKCNDLSSRSHTVFTVTVQIKTRKENGEEILSIGKLNLVDLAGSENVKTSGAEKKQATEAGQINKSLLTLGRVINALVERSSHIPYRESKLTRLLQDSLGGRTKTCIIATLSPSRSNLEETVSTLNYAFRAKNIKNKPQVNQPVPKTTILRELVAEIEKLKSDLIATRQRNGVYLTQEHYDEISAVSESRRILSQEQREKIETLEHNYRNKEQELFEKTKSFNLLKKDSEMTKVMLDGTKTCLEKTEFLLEHTKKALAEETYLLEQHQKTEQQLTEVGEELLGTLDQTTTDISGLHSKLRRRSELHSTNRQQWSDAQSEVSRVTGLVDERLQDLHDAQKAAMGNFTSRMQEFVMSELRKISSAKETLGEKRTIFSRTAEEVNTQVAQSRDQMNTVLLDVTQLRDDMKKKVGAGLDELGVAAEKISQGILKEVDSFHTQLHESYAALAKGFKSTFDELINEVGDQRVEIERLKCDMSSANNVIVQKSSESASKIFTLMEEDRKARDEENEDLRRQISALIQSTTRKQQTRLEELNSFGAEIKQHSQSHQAVQMSFEASSNAWIDRSQALEAKLCASRDSTKAKIQGDFASANAHTTALRTATSSVGTTTSRITSEQLAHLDTSLSTLSSIVSTIQSQNNAHHASHVQSLASLANTVQSSYDDISVNFDCSSIRVKTLGDDITSSSTDFERAQITPLAPNAPIRTHLRSLRGAVDSHALHEYIPTGATPRRRDYGVPPALPHTESHETLLARFHGAATTPSDDVGTSTIGQNGTADDYDTTATPLDNDEPDTTLIPLTHDAAHAPIRAPHSPSKTHRVFADNPPAARRPRRGAPQCNNHRVAAVDKSVGLNLRTGTSAFGASLATASWADTPSATVGSRGNAAAAAALGRSARGATPGLREIDVNAANRPNRGAAGAADKEVSVVPTKLDDGGPAPKRANTGMGVGMGMGVTPLGKGRRRAVGRMTVGGAGAVAGGGVENGVGFEKGAGGLSRSVGAGVGNPVNPGNSGRDVVGRRLRSHGRGLVE